MLENVKNWWKGLERGQKYSFIITILVLTLIPSSLLAFKYQRIFFSKAANGNFGNLAVIDTASSEEYANSANPETVPAITSTLVKLRITFPANLAADNTRSRSNNLAVSNSQTKVLGTNTVTCASLGGRCGNENYVIWGGGSCSVWEHSKGDSAETYPDCSGNYAYCYTSCSGGSTTTTNSITQTSQSEAGSSNAATGTCSASGGKCATS